MTANKRIFLNVTATYCRSLFSLFCALFSSRWILMTLGAVDYGLYGMIGGVIGFVTFFNTVLSLAVGRFYAYEVGRASVAEDGKSALEECRAWFSTAVFLHTLIPLFLVLIGWPLGEYAVRHWLTIPADRLYACVWVFRFSCITCLVGMMSVPFNAMYTAKQYIAELTLYSIASTSIRVIVLYYMVTHPGDWLVGFGFLMMALGVVPNLLIGTRACLVFPECRLRIREMMSWPRVRQLGNYAGWELFGMGAWTCRASGLPVLINEYLGPAYNSAMTIATAISGHANSLSACLTGSFAPAVTNACGAGNLRLMRDYAFRVCKIGTLLMLLFAVPIFLEVEGIVLLWLKDPPIGVSVLARYVMVTMIFDRLSAGHHLAVCANGKIGRYQVITSSYIFAFLPVAWIFLVAGLNVHAVGLSLVITFGANSLARVWCSRKLVDMSVVRWIREVVIPVVMAAVSAIVAGMIPVWLLTESIIRIAITSFIACSVLVLVALVFGLDHVEREYLLTKMRKVRAACWLKER